MAARVSAGAQEGAQQEDEYLRPDPALPPAGLAPNLAGVLRRRRDRVLLAEEAARRMAELRAARPDLYPRLGPPR